MYKKIWPLIILLAFVTLAACNSNDENEALEESDELVPLEVEFEPPETADIGETVELKAIVTFGDELVDDADDVNFEYWIGEDKDNSITVDSTNNGDGSYTAEVTFEEEGIYSMYAHTTARDLHTMPKRTIAVGDVEANEHHDHGDHAHVDGFNMHFMEPDNPAVDSDTDLIVHLQMDGEPFENAEVRYEIWNDGSDQHEWIDADESVPGEYVASHTFSEVGTYTVQIHVEDDDGLHEHEEHQFEINE